VKQSTASTISFFTPFIQDIEASALPQRFTYPFDYQPHNLCLLAAKELQAYLQNQTSWEHNFGLIPNKEGKIIGKMFGVLLVKNVDDEVGYLSAFSGKLTGLNPHQKFVPSVFENAAKGGFLNEGMQELTRIIQQIKTLEAEQLDSNQPTIIALKAQRKAHSIALQNELFDQYHFLNQANETKSLRQVFEDTFQTNPPSGAGECAAPKLLQYAFQQEMQPLAIAEFWWGLSPKSAYWEHGSFYPVCHEKCEPILEHMLKGMAIDEKPKRK